jgi:TolB-like protein/Flp pilus assembly protein TadD
MRYNPAHTMIGTTLSRFEITGKLGEGGMGEVYRALDTELDREVALKLLPADMADDPERLERFKREAKSVAALNHPNIVTIHNIEESEGRHFLTMELVDGDSVDKLIPKGGLPLPKLFDIAIPMADALAVAHEKGIVHRDLKPANVMMSHDGRVKVLDFGLAKLAAAPTGGDGELAEMATRTALTGEGMLMGTAPYMSPEQLDGRPVDQRTDLFAMGVMLYEMATGHRPFQGDTSAALVTAILRDQPQAITDVNETLPRHLARVVQHCLEKNPRDRYQSALDVRNELRSLRREVDSGVVQTGSGSMPAPSMKQEPAPKSKVGLWAGIAAAAVVVLGVAWWIGRGSGQESAAVETAAPAVSPEVATVSDKPSVAVLPFANLSADPENEFFTDGLTEELIQALGKVEGLQIPARTSVFALKGSNLNVQEIGERLGVGNVLEGSVRKSGNQLRISAQLIKVTDGFELWSETYDRELEDVFVIQDEIASSIVGALQLTLSPGEEEALHSDRTTDIKAYDFYLRGRGYFRRRTKEDFDSAKEMFSKSIGIDPSYAPAYAGLADTYTEFWRNYESTDENLQKADEYSRQAVELGPESAEAHAARGYALGQLRRYDEAVTEFETAIELGPTMFEAYFYYGTVAFTKGDLEIAAEMFEKASQSAPDDIRALQLLPQVYRSLGRPKSVRSTSERRLALAERLLELDPDDVQVLLYGANALANLGERVRSLEWAERVLKAETDDALVLYNIACFYSLAGEIKPALEALERSYEAGLADPEWMRQDSDLDNLRDDPRFQELVERMEARG